MNSYKLKNNKNEFFKDPLIINPRIFEDSRGIFFESWNKHDFEQFLGNKINFIQDNISISSKGVLRGIHYQLPEKEQGKLVRCANGSLYDVIVDLRISSETFKCWGAIQLDAKKNNQLWIPPGFGHGFLSLEDNTILEYKVTNYWSKEHERTLIWNDKTININWPDIGIKKNLSEKDLKGESFEELYSKKHIFK
tara:strand:- start:1053 stop:1634 length:582 start_codon:yes stop_codon:yes gene_type:complete